MSAEVKATVEEILADKISCGERLYTNMGLFCQSDELCKRCQTKISEAKAALDKHYMQEFLEIIGEDEAENLINGETKRVWFIRGMNENRKLLRDAVTKKWGNK